MGRLGKILSFVGVTRNGAKVRDVKADMGGGVNATAEHYSAPGDDSQPLAGDYVATVTTMRSGVVVAVGHLDPKNEHTAQAGEKRIYSRDAGGGTVADVWLKNDGTIVHDNDGMTFEMRPDGSIEGNNGAGSFELTAGGDFIVNGVTIDITGNITATGLSATTVAATASLTAAALELVGHVHLAGVPPNTTGPNV